MSPAPKGAGARKKGQRFELEIVRDLKALGWVDARRTPHSGAGWEKGDISGVPGHFLEAKRQEGVSLWATFAKTIEQCPVEQKPVVLSRKNRGKTIIAMRLRDVPSPDDKLLCAWIAKGKRDLFDALTYQAIAVAGTGIEPAIVAAPALDADPWLIRFFKPTGWTMLGEPPSPLLRRDAGENEVLF